MHNGTIHTTATQHRGQSSVSAARHQNNRPRVLRSDKLPLNYELLFLQTICLLGVINAHYMCIESYIHNIFNYYTWLIAFFIFLSGLLFAQKALKRKLFPYFWHKCKTLLLPALFVNLCYGIISNVLRRYGFIEYGTTLSLRSLFISPFLNNDQFGCNLAQYYIFQLFLIEILANCLYRIPIIFTKKPMLSDSIVLAVSFALSYYCFSICRKPDYKTPEYTLLLRTGYLFFYFVLGVFYERYIRVFLEKWRTPVIGCFLAIFTQVLVMTLTNWPETVIFMPEMNAAKIQHDFVPYFTFLTAAVFMLCLARTLSPVLEQSKTLRFIGPNLRYVFYHHQFTVFFIGLIIFIIWLSGDRGEMIARFNPISFRRHPWYCFPLTTNDYAKVPYMIAAFFGPVMIGKYINKCSKTWVRVLLWILLMILILAFITFFGRKYQDVIRNIN